MTTVTALLARAKSAIGKGTKYKLGAGGIVASAPLPSNMNGECDCSGFVCWALGISRKTDHPLYLAFNGGWINTDAMVHDAKKDTGFFSAIAAPRPGCLIVYPSRGAGKVGHVGIVSQAAGGRARRVVHCSSGNFRNGDAIAETDAAVFDKVPTTIFAWYAGIE